MTAFQYLRCSSSVGMCCFTCKLSSFIKLTQLQLHSDLAQQLAMTSSLVPNDPFMSVSSVQLRESRDGIVVTVSFLALVPGAYG
jgi:hypothetical protein